jgi:hypothetical protein
MTGGSERWPDLGSQNERLVTPLADQDERLVDPQTARQAGLPVAPRPLVPRSRPAADDEPARERTEPGEPGHQGRSGLRRLRRGRSMAAAAVIALAATALAAAGGVAVLGPRNVWVFGFGFGAHSRGARHWNRHRWARTSVAALLPGKAVSVHPRLVDIYEQSPSSVWAVGSGYREQGGGPVVVLHFDGHAWSKATQGGAGNPWQIVPDGSGGLWIPVPTIDGIDGATGRIMHVTGGHLTQAPLPVSPEEVSVQSISNAPGTTRSFAAGFTHARFDPTSGVRAVLLQVN